MNYALSSDLLQTLQHPLEDLPVNILPIASDGAVATSPDALQLGGHVTPAVLSRLLTEHPSIRWLSAPSAGIEPYLVPELNNRPIVMTRPRHIHDAPVSEFALMLILAAATRLPDLVRANDKGEWLRFQPPLVAGQTLVIVGYGEIGQALAARAKPLRLRIIALRRHHEPDAVADEVWPASRLSEALAQADFAVLTAPGGAANRGLIAAPEIAALKSSAYLINVGRGDLIDEAALDRALREERFAGAFLDTFSVEPLPRDSPLWTNPRVMVTPHAAGVHAPARDPRVLAQIVANIRHLLAAEPLENQIDLHRGY
jgi:phosphoglycerate dehydrogenase-like enzyme